MKTITISHLSLVVLSSLSILVAACAEEGVPGDPAIDCGDRGTAHDGHCHCDDGCLWNGVTCALPEEVDETCAVHEEGINTDEDAHDHTACRCPVDILCPCDRGEVQTLENQDFCVPKLHEE